MAKKTDPVQARGRARTAVGSQSPGARRDAHRRLRTPRAAATAATLAIGLALTGCGAPASAPATTGEPAATDGPIVLTTFSVIADLVRQVAGDRAEVLSLTKPGVEIHGYEPTPSDLVRVHEADLVMDNGLGLERWFKRFVADVDVPHVVLSEGIEPIDIVSGEYSGRPNPHAWMSPTAAKVYVDNAVAALSDLSPEDAEYFAANGQAFKAELDELAERTAAELPDDGAALVTCEGAFSYLARDLGLQEHSLWPVNSDVEGTPQQIRSQIEFVKDNDVPAVFCESTVNDGAQQQVAAATGAELLGPLYVDSLSEQDGPVPDFLSLISHDLDVISAGLGDGPDPGDAE
ncbi:metal ABC transporter substrate-binding protein [Zhihengliuella salsuginis]|uniref:Metal ABC transporter substrate-binding protein n=1 Tax=Zhihengliuella salsuginis TaxID=578222 RepID=A0ABQ3GLG0_9MICC|nr:metal ABC transporter substrate-binding protein [Zhihengliuella salsuginis]GHD08743.1 metal ABC transporter substrate-binding protein [Zhihengliuella salsuginis]